jgi:uncharacterized protein (TIGR02300 family)
MPKDEWGTKRVCPNCGTRFYDLCRDPMTCPACGHSFDLAALLSGKSTVTTPPKSIGPMPDSGLDHDAEVLDDDDTDVDLDDDVLEDDADGDDSVDLDEIADVAAEDDDE